MPNSPRDQKRDEVQISGNMSAQLRGQNTWTRDMEDAVSWVQTGKGTAEEVDAILKRMQELTTQAADGSLNASDLAVVQKEVYALKEEIDRLVRNAQFQGKSVFSDCTPSFYRCRGNVRWAAMHQHTITPENWAMFITYRRVKLNAPESICITVPQGVYSTQGLLDKIGDIIYESGLYEQGLSFLYTDAGTIDICFENVEVIDGIRGGLSYLLYETYAGGGVGALVGTAEFANETAQIEITEYNDHLEFAIEKIPNQSGKALDEKETDEKVADFTLKHGSYTRQQLIALFTAGLSEVSVKAAPYGKGIMLYSEDGMITGFRGNMFQILNGQPGFTPVFYSNVKYGRIHALQASFTGGAVLTTNIRDEEHQKYQINEWGNQLVFWPNGSNRAYTFTIARGSYTILEMVELLNRFFHENRLQMSASAYLEGGYQGMIIRSGLASAAGTVGLDKNSSAYDTLFVKRRYNFYQQNAVITKESKEEQSATFTGSRILKDGIEIVKDVNDAFVLFLNGIDVGTIKIPAGVYESTKALADKLNELFETPDKTGNAELYRGRIVAEEVSGRLRLSSVPGLKVSHISAYRYEDNQGYSDLFVDRQVTYSDQITRQTGSAYATPSITLNTAVGDRVTFDTWNCNFVIKLNEVPHTITFPAGVPLTQEEIVAIIEKEFVETVELNTFKDLFRSGLGKPAGENELGEFTADLLEATPAVGTADCDILSTIVIDEGSDQFVFTVNNESKEVFLAHDVYQDRSAFAKMLDEKLEPFGLNVTLKENRLKYTTTAKGEDASFSITYDDGGTAMKAIYGETVYSYVMASFIHGRLTLVSMRNDGSIEVSSDTGSVFQMPAMQEDTIGPVAVGGFASTVHAAITGAAVTEPVFIDEWNRDLKFTYRHNGTDSLIHVIFPSGSYSFEKLIHTLQEKLDRGAGSGQLEAFLSGGHICIQAVNPGSSYQLEEFSGGFYDKVLCTAGEIVENQQVKILNGDADTHPAYIIGRKDVRNHPVVIKAGANDTLSLYFTRREETEKFSMTLVPGEYQSDALSAMLQKKLDEQLKEAGYPAGMLRAAVGEKRTITGRMREENVLDFIFEPARTTLPDGTYIVDGIGGSAAYSIFYDLEGELLPAYVKGTKDISGGVILDAAHTQLTLEIDGVRYSVTLPKGSYTPDTLVRMLNQLFQKEQAPVKISADAGVLKLSSTKMGKHSIGNIGGNARTMLIYKETSQKQTHPLPPVAIHLGQQADNRIYMERPAITTAGLGIQRSDVLTAKRAGRALQKITKAREQVLLVRDMFETVLGRLEQAIDQKNKALRKEKSAQSQILDEDMAEEAMELFKNNLSERLSKEMVTQSGISAELVMKLLKNC